MPKKSVRKRPVSRASLIGWLSSKQGSKRVLFGSDVTRLKLALKDIENPPLPTSLRPTKKRRATSGDGLRKPRSRPEQLLAAALLEACIPKWEEEFRFHETRRWKFDFAWRAHRVALEVEGGVWIGGRHTRGAGYAADCEKYTEAALLGWTVLRVVPSSGWVANAVALVKRGLSK